MRCVAVCVLILGFVAPAGAARSTSADQPVQIKLEIAQPTAIVFPEVVASVTFGFDANKKEGSALQDGNYLFLIVNDPAVVGRLFVLGASGKLYTLLFKIGTPVDDVVFLLPPHAVPTAKAPPFSVASMVRALRTGTAIPGQEGSDQVPPAFLNPRLSLLASRAYAVGPLIGMMLTLRNTTDTPLALDIRVGMTEPSSGESAVLLSHWAWPPRMTIRAIAIDEEILNPGTQTLLYLVLERRP